MVEVTTLFCPVAFGGKTHHLVPNGASDPVMKCRYCGRTEKELREEAEDAGPVRDLPLRR